VSDADEPLGLELAAEHRGDPAGVLNALHLDVDPVPPRSQNLTGYGLALKRDVIRRFDGASEPLDQEMVKLHSYTSTITNSERSVGTVGEQRSAVAGHLDGVRLADLEQLLKLLAGQPFHLDDDLEISALTTGPGRHSTSTGKPALLMTPKTPVRSLQTHTTTLAPN